MKSLQIGAAIFIVPAIVLTAAAAGWNCFVPIPYRKSCKIVGEPNWGNYYHFNYTTFPEGTTVPTFRLPLPPADLAALNRARLRGVILKIAWDGEPAPAVWSPLGDFFGTAPGINPFQTLVSGCTPEGAFRSSWYMPFRSAKIELENRNPEPVTVELAVTTAPLTRPLETLTRFHAKWHGNPAPEPEPERAIDWRILKTAGKGRFVGVALHLWNPLGGWWGEGDEKFFVDGETFPSTFGTGSEDFFGYAWGCPELFSKPYHAQPLSENNAGHVSLNRFQIAEQVPFHRSFDAFIEKYWGDDRPTLYDCVAYWYLAPGGVDFQAPTAVDRMPRYDQKIALVKGALECEKIPVLTKTAGQLGSQWMGDFAAALERDGVSETWSGKVHLFWNGDLKAGARAEFALRAETSGRYRLKGQFTRAGDYGIIRVAVNGEPAGKPIDLYANRVIPTGEIDLGEIRLAPGINRVTVEIVGKNEKSRGYFVGLDYFKPELLEADRSTTLLEAEKLKISARDDGAPRVQDMSGFTRDANCWSNDRQLFFPCGPRGRLVLEFPVAEAGEYRLEAILTRAGDYGRARCAVDGKTAGTEFDLYDPSGVTVGPVGLGTFTFEPGAHSVEFSVAGKNEKSSGFLLGVDALRLTRIRK